MAASFVILTGGRCQEDNIALAIEKEHPKFSVVRADNIGVPAPEI
jgi:hypothetical protein